ncbi:hypothetical protein OV079_15780 [Nannocystis pusilla]|uniref:Uncharacterized protein n=1 Tax=Nannocystis pusilla TaxID=889268 RepID=A0A9X3EPS5_9BACT|nr:hypothetical protein [Nannocystis pusilla]MCY1006990.1 hypothetical protein [Nannocystis pusilla]
MRLGLADDVVDLRAADRARQRRRHRVHDLALVAEQRLPERADRQAAAAHQAADRPQDQRRRHAHQRGGRGAADAGVAGQAADDVVGATAEQTRGQAGAEVARAGGLGGAAEQARRIVERRARERRILGHVEEFAERQRIAGFVGQTGEHGRARGGQALRRRGARDPEGGRGAVDDAAGGQGVANCVCQGERHGVPFESRERVIGTRDATTRRCGRPLALVRVAGGAASGAAGRSSQ